VVVATQPSINDILNPVAGNLYWVRYDRINVPRPPLYEGPNNGYTFRLTGTYQKHESQVPSQRRY
jgi:hypothetical protein